MRPGHLVRALLCAAWFAAVPPPAAAGARIAVAWDDASLAGHLAALDAAPAYAFVTPTLTLGGDGLLRAELGCVLHLSRSTGALTLVDAASWSA